MKKTLLAILLILCLLYSSTVVVFASSATPEVFSSDEASLIETSSTIEYLEDGSYLVTTIKESPTPRGEIYSKRGTKEVTLYNSDDEIQWIYYLYGMFTIETGVSVVCTDAYRAYEIFDTSWKEDSHSEWYSGNVAYGQAVFKRKVLFITTSTQNLEGAVTCDAYGVIS